jgi:cyanophycin synthetase
MVELMKKWSISSKIIVDTAKNMWFKVQIINENKNIFSVSNKEKEILFKNVDCGINTSLSLKLCDDKELTYNILEKNNIRTAKSVYINKNNLNNLDINKLSINFPIVVKPIDWWHGDGVHTDIKDDEELNNAINDTIKFSNNIILQEHIYGDEHRILVIWNNVIYGLKRIPAYVIWDWKSTIKELINIENKNPLRGSWYDKSMTTIEIDDNLIKYIAKYYNYNIDTVANNNEYITLRGISNIWAWWVPQDVSEELWDELKKECIKIAKSLWLKLAGIDIITNDLSVSLENSKWAVLEVWATPWFWWDIESTGINPAEYLLNFVFNND